MTPTEGLPPQTPAPSGAAWPHIWPRPGELHTRGGRITRWVQTRRQTRTSKARRTGKVACGHPGTQAKGPPWREAYPLSASLTTLQWPNVKPGIQDHIA